MRRLRSLLFCGLFVVALAAMPPRVEGAEPARVVLQTQSAPDGSARLTATVVDSRGAPVAESPVTFKARTTFGWLTLAETTTGADGKARTILAVATVVEEIAVEVGGEGTVRAAILLGARRTSAPRIRPGWDVLRGVSPQPGFISPYLVPLQVILFGMILGGIWATYGYVAWFLLRIRGAR